MRSPKMVIVWWKSSSERLELCRLGLLVAVPIVYPQPWRRQRRVQKRRLEPFPKRTVCHRVAGGAPRSHHHHHRHGMDLIIIIIDPCLIPAFEHTFSKSFQSFDFSASSCSLSI